MFSCMYTDNQASSTQIYPQHNPLNLKVRQETYQWEEDRFDDFVGAQFVITNIRPRRAERSVHRVLCGWRRRPARH
jgi:hypothetical protein